MKRWRKSKKGRTRATAAPISPVLLTFQSNAPKLALIAPVTSVTTVPLFSAGSSPLGPKNRVSTLSASKSGAILGVENACVGSGISLFNSCGQKKKGGFFVEFNKRDLPFLKERRTTNFREQFTPTGISSTSVQRLLNLMRLTEHEEHGWLGRWIFREVCPSSHRRFRLVEFDRELEVDRTPWSANFPGLAKYKIKRKQGGQKQQVWERISLAISFYLSNERSKKKEKKDQRADL